MDDILDKDPFWKILFKKIDDASKKVDSAEGPSRKAEKISSIHTDALKEYFTLVTNWSEKNFEKNLSQRQQRLLDTTKQFQEHMVNSSQEFVHFDEIASLSLIPEYAELAGDRLTNWKGFEKMDEETLSRLFALEFSSRMELFTSLLLEAVKFSPIVRLQDILVRHFNSDFSWAMAVAILATQENLVKQKLIELGYTKAEIKQFLKSKGNTFSKLVEWLSEEIEQKENRKLSLAFYKSSTLREMRSTIEHEGFDIKTNKSDANDILRDIEKFEKELFPDEK